MKLLQESFGPNALKILLKNDTGKVLITSEGSIALRALNVAHPVGQLIVKAVVDHHNYYGDGSKSLLFMITEGLRSVKVSVEDKSGSGIKQSSVTSRRESILICRALEELKGNILPKYIYPLVLNKCLEVPLIEDNKEQITNTCKSIIHTVLNGKWSVDVTSSLTSLLHNFIFESCSSILKLRDVVNILVDNFHIVCLKSPTQCQSYSKILTGMLLQREFLFSSEFLRDYSSRIKFILLSCSLKLEGKEDSTVSKDTIKIKTNSQLQQCAEWQKSYVQRIIKHWKQSSVHLVLSGTVFSKLEHALLEQSGIAVVQALDEEDLQYLSCVSGCRIVYDQNDELSPSDIGTAVDCKSMTINGQKFIHLEMEGCKQLILCGVTDGICQQYYKDLHSSLKCVKSWLDTTRIDSLRNIPSTQESSSTTAVQVNIDSEQSVPEKNIIENSLTDGSKAPRITDPQNVSSAFVINGGGYFEMLLHNHLDNFCSEVEDLNIVSACRILKRLLLIVPKMLHLNSFSAESNKKSFPELYLSMMENIRNEEYAGVDCKTGSALRRNSQCLEPFQSKIALIDHVCTILTQLLRIDTVVSVKKITYDNCDD